MPGVILDADSLGQDVDLSPVTDLLDGWQVYPSTSYNDIAARVAAPEVVLSNKIPLTRDLLSGAPNIRYISVMATGTNNVDLDAASELGIQVSNAVAYATPSVVQHTISLMLALSTSLPEYLDDVRHGAWQRSSVFCRLDHPIGELAGKTLGIVGHGELGSNVARVAEAFGMKILVSARPGTTPGPGRTAFNDLVRASDFLSLHCPLTLDNQHLINSEVLASMKPGAFLINTARGGLVDSHALINALNQEQIAGAAIDVLDTEPAGYDEPLINAHPRLLVTPHNAWGAIESRNRLIQQMRENIEGYLAGSPPRLVNAL
jgi:glycerate dehydrogenase